MSRFRSWIIPGLAGLVAFAAALPTGASGTSGQENSALSPPNARTTWDGRAVDVFVEYTDLDSMRASLLADPNAFDGAVILVDVPPYSGADTDAIDSQATAAAAADNLRRYGPKTAPKCSSSPLMAPAGQAGLFASCDGVAVRFIPRAVAGASLEAKIIASINGLAQPVGKSDAGKGFSQALPTMSKVVDSVVIGDGGDVTVDTVRLFAASPSAFEAGIAIDALSKTALQFPGVNTVTFTENGDCEQFWISMGGEGCLVFESDAQQVSSAESGSRTSSTATLSGDADGFAALASFPETIYPNEPNGYTDYYPTSANGRRVFLSVACHDGNDLVSGGPCIDNTSCSYSENAGSNSIAVEAVIGTARGYPGFNNLLERGYTVRVGRGTARNNISRSNSWTTIWNSAVHIPIHSNAKSENCTNTTLSGHGTLGMYNSQVSATGKPTSAGKTLADLLWQTTVGTHSPGTSDGPSIRNDLGELKPDGVEAVSAYLEAEFHTWNTGVTFLRDYRTWAWQIGNAVDSCFGKPRWTTTPYPHTVLTGTKQCSWAPSS